MPEHVFCTSNIVKKEQAMLRKQKKHVSDELPKAKGHDQH